jgi:hypothetical protein
MEFFGEEEKASGAGRQLAELGVEELNAEIARLTRSRG